jgi:hypothetical protein
MSVFSTGPSAGIYTKNTTDVLGLGATVNSQGAFVSADGPIIRFGATNPSGVVTANPGSLSLSDGAAYIAKGGTTWNSLTSVPAGSKGGYQLYNMTTQTLGLSDNSAAETPLPNASVTFAAGTLSAASSIRVRFTSIWRVGAGAPNTQAAFRFRFGPGGTVVGGVTTSGFVAGTTVQVVADFNLSVLTSGGGGTGTAGSQFTVNTSSVSAVAGSFAVDTTVANTLSSSVQFTQAFAGTNLDMLGFTADFYQ